MADKGITYTKAELNRILRRLEREYNKSYQDILKEVDFENLLSEDTAVGKLQKVGNARKNQKISIAAKQIANAINAANKKTEYIINNQSDKIWNYGRASIYDYINKETGFELTPNE